MDKYLTDLFDNVSELLQEVQGIEELGIKEGEYPDDIVEKTRGLYQKFIDSRPSNPFGIPTKNIDCKAIPISKLLTDFRFFKEALIESKEKMGNVLFANNLAKEKADEPTLKIVNKIKKKFNIKNEFPVFVGNKSEVNHYEAVIIGEVSLIFPFIMTLDKSIQDRDEITFTIGHELAHVLYFGDENFRKEMGEHFEGLGITKEEAVLKLGEFLSSFKPVRRTTDNILPKLCKLHKTLNSFSKKQHNNGHNGIEAIIKNSIVIGLKFPSKFLLNPLIFTFGLLYKCRDLKVSNQRLSSSQREEMACDAVGAACSSLKTSIGGIGKFKNTSLFNSVIGVHPLDSTRIKAIEESRRLIETFQKNMLGS